jgi:hypothetical protein
MKRQRLTAELAQIHRLAELVREVIVRQRIANVCWLRVAHEPKRAGRRRACWWGALTFLIWSIHRPSPYCQRKAIPSPAANPASSLRLHVERHGHRVHVARDGFVFDADALFGRAAIRRSCL